MTPLPRRSIDEVPKEIEDKLVQDIRDFMDLFKRQPAELEVTDWATEIYKQKLYGLHNGWATGLIERAMAEPNVHRNIQRPSYVLASGVENYVPGDVLEDLGYHEVTGVVEY